MTIACLGWGSLIWDTSGLPISSGWNIDGPQVRVDFLREAIDRRITLVLDSQSIPVPCRWAIMATNSIENAKRQLCIREMRKNQDAAVSESKIDEFVSFWPKGESIPGNIVDIDKWASSHGCDFVIWTNLGPRFSKIDKRPTLSEIITHLKSLEGEERENAEEYIRRTPRQIDTAYRRAIETELGWTFDESWRKGNQS